MASEVGDSFILGDSKAEILDFIWFTILSNSARVGLNAIYLSYDYTRALAADNLATDA